MGPVGTTRGTHGWVVQLCEILVRVLYHVYIRFYAGFNCFPLVVSLGSSHSSYNNTEAGTNELRFDWSRFTWTLLKDLITNAYLPANEK
jgi:hypothetical protein